MKTKERTIKQFILWALLVLGITAAATAQGKPTISIQTDWKITLLGDEPRGIDAGLNNVLIKSRWTGNQQQFGYLHIAPSFEYARLNPNLPEYTRYAVELGYTLNTLIENFEAGVYVDYGIIKRGSAKRGAGFGGVLGYKITDNLKAIATLQYVDRQDFELIYNIKSEFKYSVFVGLEFSIGKNKSRNNWRR
tara:strand:- start:1742 stop:2317 length:576 start_codon:yes stop_codon:yes gene_type:complete